MISWLVFSAVSTRRCPTRLDSSQHRSSTTWSSRSSTTLAAPRVMGFLKVGPGPGRPRRRRLAAPITTSNSSRGRMKNTKTKTKTKNDAITTSNSSRGRMRAELWRFKVGWRLQKGSTYPTYLRNSLGKPSEFHRKNYDLSENLRIR